MCNSAGEHIFPAHHCELSTTNAAPPVRSLVDGIELPHRTEEEVFHLVPSSPRTTYFRARAGRTETLLVIGPSGLSGGMDYIYSRACTWSKSNRNVRRRRRSNEDTSWSRANRDDEQIRRPGSGMHARNLLCMSMPITSVAHLNRYLLCRTKSPQRDRKQAFSIRALGVMTQLARFRTETTKL